MSSGSVNPNFYADFGALAALKSHVKANDPKAIREAARQFESLFTDMMLKSMREAKLGEGLGESQESDFYQDMYDQQLALQTSQGKGLGLADMLVQQLTRRGALAATPAAAASTAALHAAAAPTAAVAPSAATGPSTATAAPTTVAAPSAAHVTTHGNASGAASDRQRISFIQKLAPYAQRAAAQLGVSSDSLIAQAALETGWGAHVPAGNGGGSSFNLFGVKAGTSWNGAAVSAQTSEFRQGAAVTSAQPFRVYSSVQQGVNDYVTLLQRHANYRQALGTGDDVQAFGTALQRGGYASDPDYAHKLASTAAAVKALRNPANMPLKLQADLPIPADGESA